MDETEKETEEIFERNLDLAHQHLQEVLDNPTILDDIPEGVIVVFLPENDDWLLKKNLERARNHVLEGEKVLLLPAKRLERQTVQ